MPLFVLALLLLCGIFLLRALMSALRCLPREEALGLLGKADRFFYFPFHRFFFPKDTLDTFSFAVLTALNIGRFLYAAVAVFLLIQAGWLNQEPAIHDVGLLNGWGWPFLGLSAAFLLLFVCADFLPRMLGSRFPAVFLSISTPSASPLLFLAFPMTALLCKFFANTVQLLAATSFPHQRSREELLNLLRHTETDGGAAFDAHDQKLIESVLTFREGIAREVMIPRVDLFSLSADTPIKEAARLLIEEGYSRTPIFRNTIDNIVGVLMHKDLLSKYIEYERRGNDPSILEAPIETIQKNVLHTPETKRLSSLLQEFRKKQMHLAIVVDEYGGTEGIVTIEDILEEIVGEISDEYDEEEALLHPQPDGSWIVDARLNLWDADEAMSIKIPQEGEYDTIGGYIFHVTGTIPNKGFVIHQNQFDMEILESNDRCVEKVRIKKIE